jgi:hypothetical protein
MYQVVRVPVSRVDAEEHLQRHLAELPSYLRVVGFTRDGDAWILLYEDIGD